MEFLIKGTTEWEVGLGTVSMQQQTLQRTTIITSSNSDNVS